MRIPTSRAAGSPPRLREAPLRRAAGPGSPEVVVDDATLLRTARFVLGGDGPGNLSSLPELIETAAQGSITDELAQLVADDPLYCAGYRPLCAGQEGFAHGVFLTHLCQGRPPSPDPTEQMALRDLDPAYQTVFVDNPWNAACEVWPVVPEGDTTGATAPADVPMLLITGQLDSFTPRDPVRALTESGPRVWWLEVAGQTHNVLGFSECALTVRNQWVRDPTSPPPDATCPDDPVAAAP